MPQNLIPNQFKKFKNVFDVWHNWLKSNSLSPLEACLQFLYQIAYVDNIIIGVQSESQLLEIMKVQIKKIENLPKWPKEIDEKILNPSEWD